MQNSKIIKCTSWEWCAKWKKSILNPPKRILEDFDAWLSKRTLQPDSFLVYKAKPTEFLNNYLPLTAFNLMYVA